MGYSGGGALRDGLQGVGVVLLQVKEIILKCSHQA